MKLGTYSLAFFLGPGFPLTLGAPSAPREAALLLTPFFFMPSVGGGIDEGVGVPLAAGVFEADSDGSPRAWSTGMVLDVVDEAESFAGDSSLMGDAAANLTRLLGDSLSVTIMEPLDDFRREPVGGAMVRVGEPIDVPPLRRGGKVEGFLCYDAASGGIQGKERDVSCWQALRMDRSASRGTRSEGERWYGGGDGLVVVVMEGDG